MKYLPATGISLLLLICLAAAAPAFAQPSAHVPSRIGKRDVEILAKYLSGTFDSADQALADPGFENRSLQIISLWPKSKKDKWLYLEESIPAEKRVIRQLVYRISRKDKYSLRLQVYYLKDPEKFRELAQQPERAESLQTESMETHPGCDLEFTRHPEGHFLGRSSKNTCASLLPGATFQSLELIVHPALIFFFERFWLADGSPAPVKQAGGYYFRRKN